MGSSSQNVTPASAAPCILERVGVIATFTIFCEISERIFSRLRSNFTGFSPLCLCYFCNFHARALARWSVVTSAIASIAIMFGRLRRTNFRPPDI